MNVLFSHLGLLLLVLAYAVGGSYVFMALEKDREDLAVSCTYLLIYISIYLSIYLYIYLSINI